MWAAAFQFDGSVVNLRAATGATRTLLPPAFNALPLSKPRVMLDAEQLTSQSRAIGFIDTDCLRELNSVLDAADLVGVYAEMHKLTSRTFQAALSETAKRREMSNTIQARPFSAKQAALLQCRPSALINAAEVRLSHPQIFLRGIRRQRGNGGNNACGRVRALRRWHGSHSEPGVVFVHAVEPAATGDFAVEAATPDPDVWAQWAKTVKAAFQAATADPRPAPTAAARLRVQRLSAIQAALGLPTRDLAVVLGISRQALYQWLDATRRIRLHEASQNRLSSVERIAKRWSERSNTPLGAIANEPLGKRPDDIEHAIGCRDQRGFGDGGFRRTLARLQGKPKSRSQRLADAGFKRRPSPRSLPSDE
jgi:hypothetical protein